MKTSESIKEIATALSKAQGSLTAANLNKVNPHFKSKYADLSELWVTCRKVLAECGLSVAQGGGCIVEIAGGGNAMEYTTRLLHSSGEWIESTTLLPIDKMTPQGLGSATTYARRYGLAAMLGLVADEDDDGNATSGPSPRQRQNRSAKPTEAAIEKTLKAFEGLGVGVGDVEAHIGRKTVAWTMDDIETARKFYAAKSIQEKLRVNKEKAVAGKPKREPADDHEPEPTTEPKPEPNGEAALDPCVVIINRAKEMYRAQPKYAKYVFELLLPSGADKATDGDLCQAAMVLDIIEPLCKPGAKDRPMTEEAIKAVVDSAMVQAK